MDISAARVVVVGASGELGRRITRQLADRGADLVLAGRSVERLREVGVAGAELVEVDLSRPDWAEDLLTETGDVDATVYAAGAVGFGTVAEVDDDDAEELLLLNYLAPSRLVRAALSRVRPGGVIATISAVVAEQPPARMAHYAASKAAMSAFDASVRLDTRRAEVTILDIRPPHTETGLASRAITGEPPRLPTGLDPDQVARRIVDGLAADESELPAAAFGRGHPKAT